MEQSFFGIFEKNSARVTAQASAAAEKSFFYLDEAAGVIAAEIASQTGDSDVLRAILDDEDGARPYLDFFDQQRVKPSFAPINGVQEPFFLRQNARFARLCVCRGIAKRGKRHSFAELAELVFGHLGEIPAGQNRKIAFLRNRQTFLAFECFAKILSGVSVLYENNFQNACEAVMGGEAAYAIIPIYSTADGRLNSFYRMIEQHELCIVLSCDIESDDGESVTTFALVHRDRICIGAGAPRFECKITLDDLSSLSDITEAAYYFGAGIVSIEALPMMFSGRAGTFSIIFDLSSADADGLLCYLALEYPQMSALGVYAAVPQD
ncbi:MAG: hypothetical protein IJV98_05130 [Clostridia bacterium]|nr:hypothetical protein [Clostridia bacterium]